MTNESQIDTYSEAETVVRREAALKNMLATPHKAHRDSKKGNRESPRKNVFVPPRSDGTFN